MNNSKKKDFHLKFSTKFSKELCLKCLCQIFELIKLEFCLPNSVRNYAAKISDVYKSLINNSRKKFCHIKISTFSRKDLC